MLTCSSGNDESTDFQSNNERIKLEEAFKDGQSSQVMCFEPGWGELKCELGPMHMTTKGSSDKCYKIKRMIQKFADDDGDDGDDDGNGNRGRTSTLGGESAKQVNCWVCQGTGRTSKWLESVASRQLMEGDVKKEAEEEMLCLVCGSEPVQYGISAECEHHFCADCLRGSLKAILDTAQFPACCPVCRADNGGKAEEGLITRPVLTFLQQREVIDKPFQFRFIQGMQRNAERNGEVTQNSVAEAEMAGLTSYFECPARCGHFLVKQPAKFDLVGKVS